MQPDGRGRRRNIPERVPGASKLVAGTQADLSASQSLEPLLGTRGARLLCCLSGKAL